MSSITIPKEKQTAYQRWEMSSFGDNSDISSMTSKKREPSAKEDQLSKYLEGARKEGYAKGVQEGFAVGLTQAREHSKLDKERFLTVMNSFSQALKNTDEEISESLLALAMDIAKAMLKTKLEVDRESVLPVVRSVIHYLPYVEPPAVIVLHPEDARIVREHLVEELEEHHWQIQEDENIERGGCMVETGANQIDATNATRWKRICEAFGQVNPWADK